MADGVHHASPVTPAVMPQPHRAAALTLVTVDLRGRPGCARRDAGSPTRRGLTPHHAHAGPLGGPAAASRAPQRLPPIARHAHGRRGMRATRAAAARGERPETPRASARASAQRRPRRPSRGDGNPLAIPTAIASRRRGARLRTSPAARLLAAATLVVAVQAFAWRASLARAGTTIATLARRSCDVLRCTTNIGLHVSTNGRDSRRFSKRWSMRGRFGRALVALASMGSSSRGAPRTTARSRAIAGATPSEPRVPRRAAATARCSSARARHRRSARGAPYAAPFARLGRVRSAAYRHAPRQRADETGQVAIASRRCSLRAAVPARRRRLHAMPAACPPAADGATCAATASSRRERAAAPSTTALADFRRTMVPRSTGHLALLSSPR